MWSFGTISDIGKPSLRQRLDEILPFPPEPEHRSVLLVGGPADEIRIIIPLSEWDKGSVYVDYWDANGMPRPRNRAIYKRVGRDNAAFEYAGDE